MTNSEECDGHPSSDSDKADDTIFSIAERAFTYIGVTLVVCLSLEIAGQVLEEFERAAPPLMPATVVLLMSLPFVVSLVGSGLFVVLRCILEPRGRSESEPE